MRLEYIQKSEEEKIVLLSMFQGVIEKVVTILMAEWKNNDKQWGSSLESALTSFLKHLRDRKHAEELLKCTRTKNKHGIFKPVVLYIDISVIDIVRMYEIFSINEAWLLLDKAGQIPKSTLQLFKQIDDGCRVQKDSEIRSVISFQRPLNIKRTRSESEEDPPSTKRSSRIA